MPSMQTISLRDAGRELAKRSGATETVSSGKMLSLLQSGTLTAGFHFPLNDQLIWIEIPSAYWSKIGNDKFRVIRRVSDDKRSGAFKVALYNFAKLVATQTGEANNNGRTLEAVLSAAAHSYEVMIAAADWQKYIDAQPDKSQSRKLTGGRGEKTGWRDLSVIIGAYIIKHYQETKEHIKVEQASEFIHALAKKDQITDLPSARTIQDHLSKIRKEAGRLSIK